MESNDPEKELHTKARAHAAERAKKKNRKPDYINPNNLTEAGQIGYDIYVELFNNTGGWWWSDPNLGGDGTFTVQDFVTMILFEESNSISRAPFFDAWTQTNVRGFYQWMKGQDAQFTSGSAGLLNYMWGTSGRSTRTAVSFDGGPGASIEIPAMQGVVNAMLNPASANHPEWADGCVPGSPCYMGSYNYKNQDPTKNLPYIFDFLKHGCSPRWGPLYGTGGCNKAQGSFIFFLDRCQAQHWYGKDDPSCP